MTTQDRAAELEAALAFLPDASTAARYNEPKQGVMEILARVRKDAGAADDLAEAARALPEAFDDEMLDYMIRAARVHAISPPMCRALEAIVVHRGSVPSVLDATVMDILEEGELDDAARLATTCAERGSSHRDAVMSHLVRYVYARDSFISFEPRPDWLRPLLHRLADLNAQHLADLLVIRLRDADDSARHGAATFAGELAIMHPEVASTLRPAVLGSLQVEGFLFESGTTSAVDALAAMYIEDPRATHAAITTFRAGARDRARKRALRVYERALYLGTPHPSMGEFLELAILMRERVTETNESARHPVMSSVFKNRARQCTRMHRTAFAPQHGTCMRVGAPSCGGAERHFERKTGQLPVSGPKTKCAHPMAASTCAAPRKFAHHITR